MEKNGLKTVVVAGLGLMGGSIALALQKASPVSVWGIDRDPQVLMQALRRHAIDEVCNEEKLAQADMLVLALPPHAAVECLKECLPHLKKDAIVTDICGVKREVLAACAPMCREAGVSFIGGHPMAGKEKSGFANADAALFVGASYILTPTEDTPPSVMDAMHSFVQALGCTRLTVTTPEEHDRMIAFTSQLPHILAGCYVQSPCSARHEGFSAGSYRDVSRVAAVDESLWTELFLANSDLLSVELDQLIERLDMFQQALERKDAERITAMIREGRLCKQRADALPPIEELKEKE